MLIVFDKLTGKRITDFGTNNAFPEGVPYEPQANEVVYRINDEDPWVAEYLAGDLASVTGTVSNGEVIDIQIPVFVPPVPEPALPQPPSMESRVSSLEDAITVLMGL